MVTKHLGKMFHC